MSKCLVCNISKEIMDTMNIEYSYVNASDLNKKIKDLLSSSNKEEIQLSNQLPFIYIYDYSNDEMDSISHTLKSKGISCIKAVNTPMNIEWVLKDLLSELNKEHEMFQTMHELQRCIQEKMSSVDINQTDIKNTLMAAYMTLQQKDLKLMRVMIQKVKDLK